MLRKKDVVKTSPGSEFKQKIADYFGLMLEDVAVEPQPETFSIYIDGIEYAQAQFKLIAIYGNDGYPGGYNFKKRLLVRWTGTKVQPV